MTEIDGVGAALPVNDDDMIKVRLLLDHTQWHGCNSEGVWAKRIATVDDKAIVEICNIPFYSRSVSYGDKITAVFNPNEGVVLEAVVERSGHSTYRVLFERAEQENREKMAVLNAAGCSWESTRLSGGELFALDVPSEVNLQQVYAILDAGEKAGDWIFKDGHVGHSSSGETVAS